MTLTATPTTDTDTDTATSAASTLTRATEVDQRAGLVTIEWLQARLGDPRLRIVEVDVSPASFDGGHIDGAVLWNVYRDLKDSDYQPIGDEMMQRLVQASGITADSVVVFYGYAPALAFWLMQRYGHAEVHILDCSRDTWRDSGLAWTAESTRHPETEYPTMSADERLGADAATVRAAIDASTTTLLDVRTGAEYRGERFWPSGGMEPAGRAGHVPSAVNVSIDGIYDERGAFRDPANLREVLSAVDLDGDGELITYCTIGGRAATAWFVLTYLLDRDHVRIYDGSWAQWGRNPQMPVATG